MSEHYEIGIVFFYLVLWLLKLRFRNFKILVKIHGYDGFSPYHIASWAEIFPVITIMSKMKNLKKIIISYTYGNLYV